MINALNRERSLRKKMKPILFNTEMVKAILSGRKTMTRRVVKPQPRNTVDKIALERFHAPYQIEDILYVRETWAKVDVEMFEEYIYKADWKDGAESLKWRPSIYMPKKAARIFLYVKDVRVERLQDMRLKDFLAEGVILTSIEKSDCVKAPVRAKERFFDVWDSTIKPADRDKYGWDANPWVWVVEFEQISKSKALEEV